MKPLFDFVNFFKTMKAVWACLLIRSTDIVSGMPNKLSNRILDRIGLFL